eukprot:gene19914-biopygen2535
MPRTYTLCAVRKECISCQRSWTPGRPFDTCHRGNLGGELQPPRGGVAAAPREGHRGGGKGRAV